MNLSTGCQGCGHAASVARDITMAFQPIVDTERHVPFAFEALVRGRDGRGAAEVLAGVDETSRYAFDQACRMVAIERAAELHLPALLSINFLPNAVYNPEHCLRATLASASRVGWPLQRVIFEVTEQEEVVDHRHLVGILAAYKSHGFLTAIDDFGAGYAGFNLLADFQPDLVKLDMGLIRGIDGHRPRQRIVHHMVQLCADLDVRLIAEGVETVDEYLALRDLGIVLQQGFLFARPSMQAPLAIDVPRATLSH